MAKQPQRVRMEEVDWSAVMPWTALLRTFRLALRPGKMAPALLLVVLAFLAGKALDAISGAGAYPREITAFAGRTPEQFHRWRKDQEDRTIAELRRQMLSLRHVAAEADDLSKAPNRFSRARAAVDRHFDAELKRLDELAADPDSGAEPKLVEQRRQQLNEERRQRLRTLDRMRPTGVFSTAVQFKLDAFDRLVRSAAALQFGVRPLLTPENTVSSTTRPNDSVLGALTSLLITLPTWAVRAHPWFTLVYGIVALGLWALLGGTIARLAALDAAGFNEGSFGSALAFARQRIAGFLFTPLFPLLLAVVLTLAMAAGGVIFFNLPVLEILGGLFFGLALICGLLLTAVVLLSIAGAPLMYPAIAADGADVFDAVSRAWGYVAGRPWRWLFYNVVALVYGAITYLLVSTTAYLAVLAARRCVDLGVFSATAEERFARILPVPQWGRLLYSIEWGTLGASGRIAAVLVWAWVALAAALVTAYAVSYAVTAATWVYLLLRQSADGNELDDIYTEHPPVVRSSAPASAPSSTPSEGPAAAGDDPDIPSPSAP